MLALGTDLQGDLDLAESLYRQAVARRDDFAASDWTSGLLACLADVLQRQGNLHEAEALAEEALALARGSSHAWSQLLALGVLAHIAVDRAEYEEGLRLGLQYFSVAHTLGAKLGIAGALGTLAGVFLSAGQPERATQLLAAARALADTIGVSSVTHNRYAERVLAEARHCLDEPAFAIAWAGGWVLSPEEALAGALDTMPRPEPAPELAF
jgi:tetratricopeptide (TPR) repeat protein